MIVVIHKGIKCKELGLEFLSFDFFGKEENKEEFYKIDCKIAKKFLKENPNLKYLGSEDLAHIYEINSSLLGFLLKRTDIEKVFVYDENDDKFNEI